MIPVSMLDMSSALLIERTLHAAHQMNKYRMSRKLELAIAWFRSSTPMQSWLQQRVVTLIDVKFL